MSVGWCGDYSPHQSTCTRSHLPRTPISSTHESSSQPCPRFVPRAQECQANCDRANISVNINPTAPLQLLPPPKEAYPALYSSFIAEDYLNKLEKAKFNVFDPGTHLPLPWSANQPVVS